MRNCLPHEQCLVAAPSDPGLVGYGEGSGDGHVTLRMLVRLALCRDIIAAGLRTPAQVPTYAATFEVVTRPKSSR